tara:strand:+ start:209 stop:460 length:252 start_codon:yes stop_codon:yes gene_type:complete
MNRKILRLTPLLLKKIINEEKRKILKERQKRKQKLSKKEIVESLKQLVLLKKAQKRAGKDFQRIFEERERIKKLIKESTDGRN